MALKGLESLFQVDAIELAQPYHMTINISY